MERIAMNLKVFVDGVAVCNSMGFNISEGWVECYVTSPSGYCNQDAKVNEIMTSKLYGHIEIEDIK